MYSIYMKLLSKNASIIVLFLTLIGAFLHFYNLSWGDPYHFHPDERNVAASISQLQYPDQMNPNFFAYSSLPIYTVFFTGIIINNLSPLTSHLSPHAVSFDQAVHILRFFSALFATALIPLVYVVTKRVISNYHSKHVTHDGKKIIAFPALLAAFFTTFSTGIIQFSHFGTFEMWLTFWTFLLFWFCLKLLEKKSFSNLFVISLLCGILVATKISHIVIFVIPFFALVLHYVQQTKPQKKLKSVLFLLSDLLIVMGVSVITYFLTNPYVLLDTTSFLASMRYESSVGLNTLPVFYTQGFYDTIPVVYQFINIYPFLLNPLLTVLLVPCLFFLVFYTWKTKNSALFLLLSFFFILFLSQSLLFIKWTRYLLPTLPFVFIVIAIAVSIILTKTTKLRLKYANFSLLFPLLLAPPLFSLAYFVTAFVQPDTRLTAFQYAKDRIPSTSPILSEIYDIGITPFNTNFPNITIFNTYDLDFNSPEYNEQIWNDALANSEYIILPSQRVLQTRIKNPNRFPTGHKVYTSLLDGSAGFEKIYQTPCDIFCQITYLGDPIYHLEQTTNVFDRPTVYIFQKRDY